MTTKREVTGTAAAFDDPKMFLGAALTMGTGAAIQMQEKMGQNDVVFSDQIPVDRHGITDTQLLAVGFVLGPRPTGRELFQSAKLPLGWTKKAANHDMWSYILDERNRTRLAIFYKSAFYDRNAYMHAECRFNVSVDYRKNERTKRNNITVIDAGKIIKRFNGKLVEPDYSNTPEYDIAIRAFYDEKRQLERAAAAWLAEHRPAYKDWTAYWNEPPAKKTGVGTLIDETA